jgi:hypothetical protein
VVELVREVRQVDSWPVVANADGAVVDRNFDRTPRRVPLDRVVEQGVDRALEASINTNHDAWLAVDFDPPAVE